MVEAGHPWPEYIHQSFNSAITSDPSGRNESVFYGPFTCLIHTLFSLDGPYPTIQLKLKRSLVYVQRGKKTMFLSLVTQDVH